MKLTKRLNHLLKYLMMTPLLFSFWSVNGQTLEECHQWALQNSATYSQKQLQEKVRVLNDEKLGTQYLPQLILNGTASYQSDVFTLPFQIPGTEAPEIPKDQYNLSLNIQQNLFDGGMTKSQRQLATAQSNLKITELSVKDDQITQIINELFFGIVQLEAQLQLQSTLLTELENRLSTAVIRQKQGLILPSQVKQLQKEQLKIIQLQTALELRNQAHRSSLSDWTGQDLTSSVLSSPQIDLVSTSEITRKELLLFGDQQALLSAQSNMISGKLKPRLFAFANVGLGQPNPMNFFETDWNGYYMIGAKLQWQLWDWGSSRKEREVLGLQQQGITHEKEHFLQKVSQQKEMILGEIRQLESQLTIDAQLVKLQEDILSSASLQLDEGTLSHSDYVSELNSLNQIKSTQINHRIQLDFQKINYLTLIGQL